MVNDGAVVVERQLVRAGVDLELDDVGAGIADGDRQLDRRGRPARRARRTHLAADRQRDRRGAAGRRSSIRNLAVTWRPTRPKLGDCSITISRSRSSCLPAISAVQRRAAQLGRQRRAGTSCTWPSVISTTPASRSARHVDQRRRSASNSRVPPAARCRAGCCAAAGPPRALRGFLLAELAASAPRAPPAACARRSPMPWLAVVDDDQRDIGDRLALLLDQRRVGEGAASTASAERSARACRARRRAGRAAPAPARPPPSAASTGHGSSGSKATETAERQCFIAAAFAGCPAHGPGRPCSCRSAHASRD